MSNTYTKIYLHLIFAVKGREALLPAHILPQIYTYIAGTLRNFGHYPVALGGIDNHIHILIDYNAAQPLPDMVREIKTSVTKYINNNHLIPFRFAWQRGYSCFSHSKSQIEVVKRYVEHQHEHHKNHSFKDELIDAYTKLGIEYNEDFIFVEY